MRRRFCVVVVALPVVVTVGLGASLLQEAPPKAFSRANPFAGDEAAARAGEKLFLRECAECHGRTGQGIGKRPPLASRMVAAAPPGAIEWVIRSGSSRRGMPSFSHLPEPQRWQIVSHVKRLAAASE